MRLHVLGAALLETEEHLDDDLLGQAPETGPGWSYPMLPQIGSARSMELRRLNLIGVLVVMLRSVSRVRRAGPQWSGHTLAQGGFELGDLGVFGDQP